MDGARDADDVTAGGRGAGGPLAADPAGGAPAGVRSAVDRREQLLRAAEELVAEAGYAAVSVRAVAQRAGLGASTLRYWFPRQEDLLVAVARRAVDPHLDDRRIAERDVPAADRLAECVAQLLPADDAQLHLLEPWAALLTDAVGPRATPLGRALLEGGVQATAERVRTWVDRLVDEGALDAGRAATAVTALLTRADGLALGLLSGTVPDVATAHAVLRADVDALLRAAP